jgi:glycosyltransferase involved in cell wall biosynthesis
MPRLAWFTPIPPSRSGIAAYNEELLPLLASRYQVDVFTSPLERAPRPQGHPEVFEARDFAWKHFTSPYDLVVYQLGNAMCHTFMWPHLFRHPGLVVLHDAQLHHSRARVLLAHGRVDDYYAEFRANHPGAPEGAPELVIRDLADSTYYFWPMLKLVLQNARHVAVHAPRLAATLADEFDIEVDAIRMGVADPRAASTAAHPGADPLPLEFERRRALRARYGLTPDHVVFAAFGLVTPEKRISQILGELPALLRVQPSAHLLLVGGAADHYDALAEARRLGVAQQVTLTGYVPDDEIAAHLSAADVCLCLRWPTGRETSASWLRALAAGRPTVVTNLAHADEMAHLDPRTWTVERAGSGAAAQDRTPTPVCVGIDILDERHSLALALMCLATDPALRTRLGRAAREHWERYHTLACMAQDYNRVLDRAMARPVVPARGLPAHLRADGTDLARRLLAGMHTGVDFLRRPPTS